MGLVAGTVFANASDVATAALTAETLQPGDRQRDYRTPPPRNKQKAAPGRPRPCLAWLAESCHRLGNKPLPWQHVPPPPTDCGPCSAGLLSSPGQTGLAAQRPPGFPHRSVATRREPENSVPGACHRRCPQECGDRWPAGPAEGHRSNHESVAVPRHVECGAERFVAIRHHEPANRIV